MAESVVLLGILLLCLLLPAWFIYAVKNRKPENAPFQKMVDKIPLLAAVLNIVLLAPVTVVVGLSTIFLGSFSEINWCCDGTGEYEAALSLLVIAVPAYFLLTRSCLKLDTHFTNPFFEHLRQCWILYGFAALMIYNYFTNVRGVLDSGEPGRAILLAIIATSLVALTTNFLGLIVLRVQQTYKEMSSK